MRFFICAVTICLFSLSRPITSLAEDRTLSGVLPHATIYTYGDVRTLGETSVVNNTTLRLSNLGSTVLNPGFSVALGSVLRIGSMEKSPNSEWLLDNFGSLNVDMGADPDGDGFNNFVEFQLGSDPNVASSDWLDSDNDSLADSWELKNFSTLSFSPGDDPNDDGQTLETDFLEFLDFLYTYAFLYLEGTLTTNQYRAREIHSRNTTTIPSGSVVHLTKVDNAVFKPGFSVKAGGALTVFSSTIIPTDIQPPGAPENVSFYFPDNSIGLTWSENPEVDIAGYRVYRNEALVTPVLVEAVTYVDTDVVHGQYYTYQITAVDKSGKESEKSSPLSTTADFVLPQLISGYPADGELITTNGEPLSLIFVFGDSDSGISEVQLLDTSGKDVSYKAKVTANSLELILVNPTSGLHSYTLIVKDNSGNTFTDEITFTIDATLLVTTAIMPGGNYSSPQTVDLTSSKDATIYYTTDGFPPVIGQSLSGTSPVIGIPISTNTSLQFFAVDQTGFREKTKTEIYVFETATLSPSGLQAVFQQTTNSVNLSWQPVNGTPVNGYKIYRCENIIECDILEKSREGKYPPPPQLALPSAPTTETSFTDQEITTGATYGYGIFTLTEDSSQSILSELTQIEIPATDNATNSEEAISRASAWLTSKQEVDGLWKDDDGLAILTTSQAIHALFPHDQQGVSLDRALFNLRGLPADNNDFLARQIITLQKFDQNSRQAAIRLLSKANFQQGEAIGWGVDETFSSDAVDTSFGLLASTGQLSSSSLLNIADGLLTNPDFSSAEGTSYFSWTGGQETSGFVTALAHYAHRQITGEPYPEELYTFTSNWLTTSQNCNGSHNDSLVDTAAILLWLGPPGVAKDAAMNYLVGQQDLNGSWNNDIYLTAFCLEALKKGVTQ